MNETNPTNGEPLDANPTKGPSLDDMIKGSVTKFRAETDVAVLGKSKDFAALDIDRYMSYGSETFGKLGYSPHRDNSKLYNENTHWSADISRAYTGMLKLAGVGRSDTFAFGAFSEKDSHKTFDKIMSTYGSTRGGAAGFISNTMLSAGYTKGIIEAIAIEEAILIGTTGGLGNIATAGEVARAVKVGSNILGKADKIADTTKGINATMGWMKNIRNSRLVKNLQANKVAKAFTQYGKQLLPGGDTMAFLRNVDNMPELNRFQKAFTGAASLSRDSRKIHMTMAESNLEASLASDEVREAEYSEWYSNNVGQEMDGATREAIEQRAKDVHRITYNANFGLIYATNAITFNTMFRSMRYTNKAFNISRSGRFTNKIVNGKFEFKALKKNLSSLAKKKIESVNYKNASRWALTASVEGDQELGQDLIAGFAKRYVAGDEKLRGSFYDSMLAGMSDMHAESFFSGMLMGTFAAPTSIAIRESQNFVLHGGHKAITKRKAWKDAREADYTNRVKDAKILTDYFNSVPGHLEATSQNVFTQAEAQEKMATAAEQNDRKAFEDERAEAFRLGMETVMKHGLETEYSEYLSGLKKHTAEELNEALGRKDITEENIGEFHAKVDVKVKDIKEFKAIYDEVHEQVNPIDVSKLEITDPQFNQKYQAYLEFEHYRKELMYSKDGIRDLAKRLSSLGKELTQEDEWSKHSGQSISSQELSTLVDTQSLAREVSMLSAELKADKQYDVAPQERAKKEQKLEALKSYQKALIEFDKLDKTGDTDAVHDEMFNAFNNLVNSNLNIEGDAGQRELNYRKFDKFWDYLVNSKERASLQKHANMLLDPNIAARFMQDAGKVMKDIEKNKGKHILDSLTAFDENRTGSKMMTELRDEGYFFDMDEIDDLIKRRIMPSRLYNVKNHKELSIEEVKKAQEIINRHVKRLTGKHVLANDTAYATRKKDAKDSRSLAGIIRTFSKSKKDTPIPILTFIKKLLKSPHITKTEADILKNLVDLKMAEGNVILTDSAEAPISVDEDGTIRIDVRFSARDFNNDDTPFEALAVSALLQAHYAERLKSDPVMKAKVVSAMKKARDAYIVRREHDTTANIGFFTDPIQFMSEALNNEEFQKFLASIEDTESPGTTSLWDTFMTHLREMLSKIEAFTPIYSGRFEGTLLNRAVKLSQLALTDEQIDITLNSQEAEETKEETNEEKKEEKTETVDLKTKLKSEIKDIELEISEAKKDVGSVRKFFGMDNKVRGLEIKLNKLRKELKEIPEDSTAKTTIVIPKKSKSKKAVDKNGEIVINNETPFREMPIELKVALAIVLAQTVDYTKPVKKTTSTDEAQPDALTGAQSDFEEGREKVEKVDTLKDLGELNDDDILEIESKLADGSPRYLEALEKYNKGRISSQESNEEEELEEEGGRDDSKPTTHTLESLSLEIKDLTTLYSESDIETILGFLNSKENTLEEVINDANNKRNPKKSEKIKTESKSSMRYVKKMLRRIEVDNISAIELVAMHRKVMEIKGLSDAQKVKLLGALHGRISDVDVFDKNFRIGNDIVQIVSEESNVDSITFKNVATDEISSPIPSHKAMTMIDEVLADNSEYKKQDTDTTTTPEDNRILKQAYSKVFDNFTKETEKVDNDSTPEVLKASIIEEFNKCK